MLHSLFLPLLSSCLSKCTSSPSHSLHMQKLLLHNTHKKLVKNKQEQNKMNICIQVSQLRAQCRSLRISVRVCAYACMCKNAISSSFLYTVHFLALPLRLQAP